MENQETLYVNRIILGADGQPISQDNIFLCEVTENGRNILL